ncbi:MAG: leucine-rich repeat domain-containing protein [Oscillospiraceae bacterium]|nr:leucine-rich repeat domain-containing protein [Oscillospiraceae bacterium]
MQSRRCGRCGSADLGGHVRGMVCAGCGAFYDMPVTSASDFVIKDGVLEDFIGWGTSTPYRTLLEEAMREYGVRPIELEPVGGIVIPEGVTHIADRVFCGCESITDVVLPHTLTSIGNGAFEGCTELTAIAFSDSLTSIGEKAFSDCRLTSLVLPDSLTSIAGSAFEYCEYLTSVTIPGSVTCIGDSAFCGCGRLDSICLSEGLTSIGNDAFYACGRLDSICLPEGLTSIGDSAFMFCKSLRQIRLPDSLTQIGRGAFDCFDALQSITIRSMELDPETIRRCSERLRALDGTHPASISDHRRYFSICLNMILTGNYNCSDQYEFAELAVQVVEDHPEDAVTRRYLEGHLHIALQNCLQEPEELAHIRHVIQRRELLTADNIDDCIEAAIVCGFHEVQLFLMHYKEEHFGFAAPEDRFRL